MTERPAEPSRDDASDDAAVPKDAYTIDQLAALTSVPSRTIRFYQAKGALLPPVRRGRVAYYDESHAERLRLVAKLQDRGLSLRAIRDLLQRTDGGDVSVAEWLGVGDQVRAPWTDDRPRVCSEEELGELVGPAARPGLVADLVRVNLVRRETNTSPTSYFLPSPALLQIALRFEESGIDLRTADAAYEILRKHLARAANDLVEYFVKHVEAHASPEDVARAVSTLRTSASDTVRLAFAQEIERALKDAIEHGKMLPPKRRKR